MILSFFYLILSCLLFFLCRQPLRHHLADSHSFCIPQRGRERERKGGGRGGWRRDHVATGFLLQIPSRALWVGWPSWKQRFQPCWPVGSTFHWRKIFWGHSWGSGGQGLRAGFFLITAEIGEIWTWTLAREVIWSPRKQLSRQECGN